MAAHLALGATYLALGATYLALCATGLGAADGVAGRVWRQAGAERAPLAGARVVLTQQPDGRLLGLTRSDSQGRFAFAGPVNGRVRLRFSRPGFTPAAGDDYRNADCSGPCGPIEMEMIPAATLSGTVRDDLGEPIVDGRVTLECDGDEGPRAFTPTDDRGRFRLSGLAPADGCRVDVDTRRMGPRAVELESEPVEVEIEAGVSRELALTLRAAPPAAVRVSGVVQGHRAEPDSPGVLFVYSVSRRGGGPGSSRRVRLEPDGKFALDDLRPGDYAFRTQGAGRQADVYLGRHAIRGDVEGLVLTPQEPWIFAGRVELDGNPPAGGIFLRLLSNEGGGAVGFEARPPEFEIRARAADLAPGEFRAQHGGRDWFIREVEAGGVSYPPEAVRLSASAAGSLVFRLSSEMASIRGRVKADAGGGAAPHFLVAIRGPHGVDSVQADQQGRFVFDKAPPGDYQIGAWAGASAAAVRADAVWDRAGRAVREFSVEPGAEIEIELTAVPSREAP